MQQNNSTRIPFNVPYTIGPELTNFQDVCENGHLSGDGFFTKKCCEFLENNTKATRSFLTHSCTAALEMMAILANLEPGDEIIMPSYTFVSTATAFVAQGCVPVFVDIREDTLNIDERLIEEAITSRTRAIITVHYAGVSCEMDAITKIAEKNGLWVFEDAAQGVQSTYNGRALGTIGHFGAYSFHETKNISCGQGGSLLIRDTEHVRRAEIVLHKGTNRIDFVNSLVNKYTWVDKGSSYLPNEITAAYLLPQLENSTVITSKRIEMWDRYHAMIEPLEAKGYLRRPIVPENCSHNGHIYYVLLNQKFDRQAVINKMSDKGVSTVFHYIPLHSSPAGERCGRAHSDMKVTNLQASRLLRLPLWIGLDDQMQKKVVQSLIECLQ